MNVYTKKYNLILRFVNTILKNIGKDKINDLTDFKDISRDDFMVDENKDIFMEYQTEIFELFDKKKIGYYRKNETKCYTLTFLRCILKEINYKITYVEKKHRSNNQIKCMLYYSITKI